MHRPCLYPPSRRGKRVRTPFTQARPHDSNAKVPVGNTTQSGLPAAGHSLRDGFSVHGLQTGDSFAEFHGRAGACVDVNLGSDQRRSITPVRPNNAGDKANVAISQGLYGLNTRLLTSDNNGQALAPRGDTTSVGQPLPREDEELQYAPEQIATNVDETVVNVTDPADYMVPLQKVNWEYHGPWSWVSICSPPGVAWVCERTNSSDFEDIASCFMKTWSQHLKTQRSQSLTIKYPEPDAETAWEYVNGGCGSFLDLSTLIVTQHIFKIQPIQYLVC